MGTKVKGLLKGLKHLSITNIFDSKEQEVEIQIGFPTDVKHVAHIGMDDANTTTKPSWMGDYKAAPELANAPAVEATSKGTGSEKSKGKRRDKDKDKKKDKDKDKEGSSKHRSRKSKDSNNLNDSEDSCRGSRHSKKKKSKGSSSSNIDEESTSKSSRKGSNRGKSLPDESAG